MFWRCPATSQAVPALALETRTLHSSGQSLRDWATAAPYIQQKMKLCHLTVPRPVKLPRQSPEQRPPQPALPRPEHNHRNLLPQPAPGSTFSSLIDDFPCVKTIGDSSDTWTCVCLGFPGNCGKCHRVKGRTERKRQYCLKDFGELAFTMFFFHALETCQSKWMFNWTEFVSC